MEHGVMTAAQAWAVGGQVPSAAHANHLSSQIAAGTSGIATTTTCISKSSCVIRAFCFRTVTVLQDTSRGRSPPWADDALGATAAEWTSSSTPARLAVPGWRSAPKPAELKTTSTQRRNNVRSRGPIERQCAVDRRTD